MIQMRTRQAPGLVEVFDFMTKKGLALADLIEASGDDLKSTNPRKVEKTKRVEKCWALMAKLGVKFADVENKPSRRRRAEGHFSQVIEKADLFDIDPSGKKSSEINDLDNSAPVGVPEIISEDSQ